MQDVLAQEAAEGKNDLNKDARCWEQSMTWGFLQKSVCKDNVLVREMVKDDKRARLVSRINKMHDKQLQMIKDNETQR